MSSAVTPLVSNSPTQESLRNMARSRQSSYSRAIRSSLPNTPTSMLSLSPPAMPMLSPSSSSSRRCAWPVREHRAAAREWDRRRDASPHRRVIMSSQLLTDIVSKCFSPWAPPYRRFRHAHGRLDLGLACFCPHEWQALLRHHDRCPTLAHWD